jgi:hypothetical protein
VHEAFEMITCVAVRHARVAAWAASGNVTARPGQSLDGLNLVPPFGEVSERRTVFAGTTRTVRVHRSGGIDALPDELFMYSAHYRGATGCGADRDADGVDDSRRRLPVLSTPPVPTTAGSVIRGTPDEELGVGGVSLSHDCTW